MHTRLTTPALRLTASSRVVLLPWETFPLPASGEFESLGSGTVTRKDAVKAYQTSLPHAGRRAFFLSGTWMTILLLYALQLLVVCYWRLVPVDRVTTKA